MFSRPSYLRLPFGGQPCFSGILQALRMYDFPAFIRMDFPHHCAESFFHVFVRALSLDSDRRMVLPRQPYQQGHQGPLGYKSKRSYHGSGSHKELCILNLELLQTVAET